MKKIFELNGHGYAKSVSGLGDIVRDPEEFFRSPSDFSLVLFTGGADVCPQFYGESSPLNICGTHRERDIEERAVWLKAMEHGVRTIGICRGLQFINVMNGGTLYHHVNGHAGRSHMMTTLVGEEIRINSYHHQMVIPKQSDLIIGWSSRNMSDTYIGDFDLPVPGPDKEVEAVIYPKSFSAGVQYHPEMLRSDDEAYVWFFTLADMIINCNNFEDVVRAYGGKESQKAMSMTF